MLTQTKKTEKQTMNFGVMTQKQYKNFSREQKVSPIKLDKTDESVGDLFVDSASKHSQMMS